MSPAIIEGTLFNEILKDVLSTVSGAQAAVFLDGEGESIAQAGDDAVDVKMLGAWKEIHLDHMRDIANRLGLGKVQAALFSHDAGVELVMPVSGDYCLTVLLSGNAHPRQAMAQIRTAVELLKREVE